MNSKKIASALTIGVVLLTGIGTFMSWYSNRAIRKAIMLHGQLFAADELPRVERNALKLDLMRTVDEMDRDKVLKLYSQLTKKGESSERQTIAKFHAASAPAEKEAILDKAIEDWRRIKELTSALKTDGVYRWYKTSKGDKLKKPKAMPRRDELSGEEQALAAERQRLRDEYYQALKARAEERGLGQSRLGKDRGRAKR